MISERVEIIDMERSRTPSTGASITVACRSDTGASLVYSLLIDDDNIDSLMDTISRDVVNGVCVDEHTQDQLIIYMALADGESRIVTGPLTLHTQTAIHFCQLISGVNFDVVELRKDVLYSISCRGIGLEPVSA